METYIEFYPKESHWHYQSTDNLWFEGSLQTINWTHQTKCIRCCLCYLMIPKIATDTVMWIWRINKVLLLTSKQTLIPQVIKRLHRWIQDSTWILCLCRLKGLAELMIGCNMHYGYQTQTHNHLWEKLHNQTARSISSQAFSNILSSQFPSETRKTVFRMSLDPAKPKQQPLPPTRIFFVKPHLGIVMSHIPHKNPVQDHFGYSVSMSTRKQVKKNEILITRLYTSKG